MSRAQIRSLRHTEVTFPMPLGASERYSQLSNPTLNLLLNLSTVFYSFLLLLILSEVFVDDIFFNWRKISGKEHSFRGFESDF